MKPETTGEPSRLALVAAFAAIYVVWGSTYLAIRIAIETLPPFAMAGMRFIIAGTALYAWARWRGAKAPTFVHWRSALMLGGFLLLGGNGAVVWSEKTVPSGIVALLVASVPLWMVIVNWIRPGGVRPTRWECIGLLLGFVGVTILVNPRPVTGQMLDPLGVGAVILGSLSWAIGSVWSQHAKTPASPFLFAGMEMLAGGVLLSIAGVVAGEWSRGHPWRFTVSSFLALIYLGVFGSIIAFSAYTWLLSVTTAAKVSTYAYVNPVVAVLLGFLVRGEPLAPGTIAAMAVIITGVAFITKGRRSVPVDQISLTEALPAKVRIPTVTECSEEADESSAERALIS
jgi:drug/metabolite transporter (DMT)-like permease